MKQAAEPEKTLLIVDDEPIIRAGLAQMRNWAALGYRVLLATGGQEALDYVEREPVDIVITDINMPGMNGLELARQVNEKNPCCAIILLSGYNEFSYAQEAIEIGVFRYLSKPVYEPELMAVLEDALEYLKTKQRERARMGELQAFFEQNRAVLAERALAGLAHGTLPAGQMELRAGELGLRVAYPGYAFLLLDIDGYKPESIQQDNALVLAVQSIAAEHLAKAGAAPLFYEEKTGQLGAVLGIEAVPADGIYGLMHIFRDMQEYVRQYLDITLTISASATAKQLADMPLLYKDALRANQYRHSQGNGAILLAEEFGLSATTEQLFESYVGELKALQLAVKNLEGDAAAQSVHRLAQGIAAKGNITKEQFRLIALDIIITLQKQVLESQLSFAQSFGHFFPPLEQLDCSSVEALEKLLLALVAAMVDELEKRRNSKNKNFIHKAKQFIQEHYMSNELNLTSIAESIFVNPTYLSQCFKQSENISCIEYLTRIRVDAAKRLLRETNQKTYAIAEAVGYVDPQYFSVVFKKVVGVSPTEYRNHSSPDLS